MGELYSFEHNMELNALYIIGEFMQISNKYTLENFIQSIQNRILKNQVCIKVVEKFHHFFEKP